MGSVYARPGSQYLWPKYLQNGRVVRESSGTTNLVAARRMLRVREGDVERGVPIDPRVGRITFDEAVADLLNDYVANGRRSFACVKSRIEMHLAPFFGNRRLGAITTSDIRAFIAKRQRDAPFERGSRPTTGASARPSAVTGSQRLVSPAEINRELTVLKRMFNLALQAGRLHFKPHIPMLRENNVRTGFFEPAQYHAILVHLPEAMRPVCAFAYVTGWRIVSEVLTLQWRQVDLRAAEVRLDPGSTKNGDGRVFYLTPELVTLLEQQLRKAEDVQRAKRMIVRHVFFHHDARQDGRPSVTAGAPIRGSGFYHAWCRARVAAGCPTSIPHDLRRTAIRNMVRAGIPERVAMTLSGHKTRSVFDRYNIVSDGDLREAARKLASVARQDRWPQRP